MTEPAAAWVVPTVRPPTGPILPATPTARATQTPRALETPIRWRVDEASVPPSEAARACRRWALLLWPRLDSDRLARTRGDPWRIARLVAERTPRPLDEIVGMLTSATPACPVVPARSRRPAVAVARTSPPR
jgi:hypothetical protein